MKQTSKVVIEQIFNGIPKVQTIDTIITVDGVEFYRERSIPAIYRRSTAPVKKLLDWLNEFEKSKPKMSKKNIHINIDTLVGEANYHLPKKGKESRKTLHDNLVSAILDSLSKASIAVVDTKESSEEQLLGSLKKAMDLPVPFTEKLKVAEKLIFMRKQKELRRLREQAEAISDGTATH